MWKRFGTFKKQAHSEKDLAWLLDQAAQYQNKILLLIQGKLLGTIDLFWGVVGRGCLVYLDE